MLRQFSAGLFHAGKGADLLGQVLAPGQQGFDPFIRHILAFLELLLGLLSAYS